MLSLFVLWYLRVLGVLLFSWFKSLVWKVGWVDGFGMCFGGVQVVLLFCFFMSLLYLLVGFWCLVYLVFGYRFLLCLI